MHLEARHQPDQESSFLSDARYGSRRLTKRLDRSRCSQSGLTRSSSASIHSAHLHRTRRPGLRRPLRGVSRLDRVAAPAPPGHARRSRQPGSDRRPARVMGTASTRRVEISLVGQWSTSMGGPRRDRTPAATFPSRMATGRDTRPLDSPATRCASGISTRCVVPPVAAAVGVELDPRTRRRPSTSVTRTDRAVPARTRASLSALRADGDAPLWINDERDTQRGSVD